MTGLLLIWNLYLTAWKVSVFEVILVCIFPHSDWMRTKITPNTDTFYTVFRDNISCYLDELHNNMQHISKLKSIFI